MHFVWTMTAVLLLISLFNNGNVKGNNLEIQVSEMLKNMLKGLAQEKVIRINHGKKLDSMEKTWGQALADLETAIENIDRHIENRLLAQIKAIEAILVNKLEERVSTIEQKFEEKIRNIEKSFDKKLIAKINTTEVVFHTKLDEKVNTTEQKFKESIEHSETLTEKRLTARINASEVTIGMKLKAEVKTTEQKFKQSMSKLNQTFGNLSEQIKQCSVKQQGRQCPSNYIWHMALNLCFRLSHEKQTWFHAKMICESEGGQLAKVNNTQVFVYLKEHIQKSKYIPRISYTSIGGNDIVQEGIWRWADGELIDMASSIWYPEVQGERNENCLIMNSELDYRMVDTSCFLKHYYLCQIG